MSILNVHTSELAVISQTQSFLWTMLSCRVNIMLRSSSCLSVLVNLCCVRELEAILIVHKVRVSTGAPRPICAGLHIVSLR